MHNKMSYEEWRPVVGYEGIYEVTPGNDEHPEGQVRSVDRIVNSRHKTRRCRGRILKTQFNIYATVGLSYNQKLQIKRLHHLIAEAFIDNPNNYHMVNHKDENKYNNRIENLEWCDAKYNNNYGTAPIKRAIKRGRKIGKYDINTGELITLYYSTGAAAKENHISQGNIYCAASGQYNKKTAGGYIWRFV